MEDVLGIGGESINKGECFESWFYQYWMKLEDIYYEEF